MGEMLGCGHPDKNRACGDCLDEAEAEVQRLELQVSELKEDLERARTYTGLEAQGCPLCTYVEGVFKASCGFHQQLDALRLQQAGVLQEIVTAAVGLVKPKSEWAICGWCSGTGKDYGKACPKCQGAGGKTLETEQCESVYPRWNVRCCLPLGHEGRHESKGGDDRTRFMWAVGKPGIEPKKDADGRIRHCLAGKDGCTGGAMSCSCVCVNCDAIRNF